MLTRRDFMQITAATAALLGPTGCSSLGRAAAGQKITQEKLLQFDPVGQVTLLNFTDIHAQLVPLYFREPSTNLGVGKSAGIPPHLTGKDFLNYFKLRAGTMDAYAFTSDDYVSLARQYGRVGGLAHMATLIKAIRAERPDNTVLIDCGDTWQGSYGSLKSRGEDMVTAMNALGVDVMVPHWEFTYGEDRVKELIKKLKFPFLAGNVKDNEWQERVFDSIAYFERSGVKVAVIGQAFPYTPIANPRYMVPDWSFGINEDMIVENIAEAKSNGADLIVLASHNGFDVDRKLAGRVEGIDVILTGHTHDAIPALVKVKDTLLVAAGSHGKFLARLDLDVQGKKIVNHSFKMIPILSDAIAPDPEIAAVVRDVRAPYLKDISEILGRTDSLLYRRGNFNGSFDDLICQAIRQERDTQIALSPGFRWGATLLPGQAITTDDLFSQTAITYPNCYRQEMTGARLKTILEDVADNLFNADPYYQQGGDMVRVGGMGYAIDISKTIGNRISEMTLLDTGEQIDAKKTYTVGGWASVNPGTEGPPIYDVVSDYIRRKKVVSVPQNNTIKVTI
ncbi:thiosulfohydrolase SoxB [Varunaivibrio sulfuroxidans]|uniref:Sulfate thiol esterase SoxB n=1 Tax=Varunaivibrio sulfuroxidans TaxID=1773489 RepID=A0A4R3JEH9_9PROT|nr:thiosulfohydrolase SoxB [Varunaivibrio sulfuroxidans]TCS64302.1 sulfate thiol esterase SoxB [Varunaivibrio sulfuroxidans]WES31262.1 thiosulfohydrolase SoxB [Varunaivibrio sulfuroxidans]